MTKKTDRLSNVCLNGLPESSEFVIADAAIETAYPDVYGRGKGWWGAKRIPNFGILRGAIARALRRETTLMEASIGGNTKIKITETTQAVNVDAVVSCIRATKLVKGCIVVMKQSSGLIGYGNLQCVSSVCEPLAEIGLYGHNQYYKDYDVLEIIEYPFVRAGS